MTTPEGKVKAQVKKVLAKYPAAYAFMPVQTGFGKKTLDFLICANGRFIAVETKAPGKEPTNLQWACMEEIQRAGGTTMVIDGPEGVAVLDEVLRRVYHPNLTQTPHRRSA